MDFGWCGLAGVFAILFTAGSLTGVIACFDLTTWTAWQDLYTREVLVLILAVLFAVVMAKVLAVAIHTCVTRVRILKFRDLIHRMVEDQGRGGGSVKKVLICHASVGSGHKRAAEAVASAIHRLDKSVEVKVVDLMSKPYADRTLIYFYKDWYLRLVGGEAFCGSLGTYCVGCMFDRANSVQDAFTGGSAFQRRIFQSLLNNFLQLVCDEQPDVVVHTHFLSPELLAGLRRNHGLRIPQVTVVTDMDVHAWWYQQPTDHYFAPRDLARHQLVGDGVPPADVTVSGIPIMPQFQDTLSSVSALDVDARRRRFLLEMDAPIDPAVFADDFRPIVIQMSTGKTVTQIFRSLLSLETPIILIVVCGRQADARSTLERIEVPIRHRVALVGYTSCIHELLAVADVVVTKPGGLITAEALACGLMMVVVDPYPGQEERNASMLLEEGVGIWIWEYRDIRPKLDAILSAPNGFGASLARYQQNSRRLAKPDAAFEVARYVLSNAPWKKMIMHENYDSDSVDESNPELSCKDTSILSNWLGTASEDAPLFRRTFSLKPAMTMSDFQVMQRIDSSVVPHMSSDEEDDLSEVGDEEDQYCSHSHSP
eukprot:TRINITY_DN15785_c0_g1_i1.p1 TRINITY_DN15785_c0_g1~~TRINITY_DN15785_c0_g1_i1.p1  ORF type:complete len:596 (-),score=83.37 TRINITY_DN15785_c0_g1_i1:15-1802(-)